MSSFFQGLLVSIGLGERTPQVHNFEVNRPGWEIRDEYQAQRMSPLGQHLLLEGQGQGIHSGDTIQVRGPGEYPPIELRVLSITYLSRKSIWWSATVERIC